MLEEFIAANRAEIIARSTAMVSSRPWPAASTDELKNGVPLFLTQLVETLQREAEGTPHPDTAIGNSATRHGGELLAKGFTLSQVVHDYGDVCQAITQLAIEHDAPITPQEFHTLNRCLDTAMAEAVAEYGRLKDEETAKREVERTGRAAHELSNRLHTALLAFHVLRTGKVGIGGSTGAALGRSLSSLRDLLDADLARVRLGANQLRHDRVSLGAFIDEVAVAANLHAENRGLSFTVEPVDPALVIEVDAPVLATAVMNLLQNAFKYTRESGKVKLRARRQSSGVLIEVEDECGGREEGVGDPFRAFGDRRGRDRSGLGLGLSISREAVTANGGTLHTRNLAGRGCVFGIELPLAASSP